MKKIFILFIVLALPCILKSQEVFTKGGGGEMYWKWRPDIADSCYEFTFINILPMQYDWTHNFCEITTMYYWNDCNYGKNYIVVNDTGFVTPPLFDTLYRAVVPQGIIDTFCGYTIPYTLAIAGNNYQSYSPHRARVEYKGLIYLPEKCDRWYFAIGFHKKGGCGNISWDDTRTKIMLNGGFYHNQLSNLDSLCFVRYKWAIGSFGFSSIAGCSFNNLDFPNNNSARFLSPYLYNFPINKNVEYTPGPFDVDGDSLVVSIPDTLKGATLLQMGSATPEWYLQTARFFSDTDLNGNYHSEVFTDDHYYAPLPGQTGPNPIRYNGLNNPFDTDSTFHLVDSTGRTTFTAKSTMQPVLYYSVKEYRNQKFVSETYRFNQFTLKNDTRPISYMKIDTISVQNAYFNNQGTLMSCAGLPISLDAYIKLPSVSNADLHVRTTADTTLPGTVSCTITNANTDSVHLKLNWQVPITAKGLYNVYISAKDSNCLAPFNHFTQVYTWSFYIDSCVAPLSVIETNVQDDNVSLFPNPAQQRLTITANEEIQYVRIYNTLSQTVADINLSPAKQWQISLSKLAPGMYYVSVNNKYVKKLVVIH
ncbi:MAG: T9SS type A sorting domain-containing protein [Bacteroidetes bacterium]|nr:T9SS type A sorting domain-containing protein [Bacteroidota bacterium]